MFNIVKSSNLAKKTNLTKCCTNIQFRRHQSDILLCDHDSNTGFRTISLNNPPVNTLSTEMLVSLVDEVNKARDDASVRGLVIKSHTSGKAFCAGLQLTELYQKSENYYHQFWKNVQEWYLSVYGCPKPIVAAINGHAPAGGCAFALMCDYRVLLKGSRIGLNEVQVGIAPTRFIANLLIHTAGTRIGEYGVLSGKIFSSEEALKAGVVDCVVEDDQALISKTTEELAKLCAVPPPAYAITKMLLRHHDLDALKSLREEDAKDFASRINSDVVQSFIETYITNLKNRKK